MNDVSGIGEAERLWRRFVDPASMEDFLAGWLQLAIAEVAGAQGGALLIAGADGRLGLAVRHRVDAALEPDIARLAETAQDHGESLVVAIPGGTLIGHRIVVAGVLQGVAVLILEGSGGRMVRAALRSLHWSSGWIEAQLWRGRASLAGTQGRSAALVLEVLAAADADPALGPAALAVVNLLAERTGFDRAAIGLRRGRRVRLIALSRIAVFRRTAELAAEIEAAMAEALLQETAVALPLPDGLPAALDLAHRSLMVRRGNAAVVTVPIIVRGEAIGALMLERSLEEGAQVTLDRDTVEEIRLAAAAIGPVLHLKARERRWWSGRARDLSGRAATALLGRRPGLVVGAAVAVLVIVALFTVQVPLRVSADAVLQGSRQRATTAAVDGFVAETLVRAGDAVRAGDLLARLDDRDLLLRRLSYEAEERQALQSRREALVEGDRSAAAVAAARVAELRAEIDLVTAQLDRLEIHAPIDGLVVSGDLSQRIGAPVSMGEVLFEIAALDAYRVLMDVSEYDLQRVSSGQTGTLRLTGASRQAVPVVVTGISAVSDPAEGENRFRVEGDVTGPVDNLRPGMEGIAKLDVGRARLIDSLLRRTGDRLRVLLWRFTP